jgi:hypothetical protein
MVVSNFSNNAIVTPINKDPKSKSRIDYNEQIARSIRSEQLMWDDAKGNPTHKVGGAFGFVQNSNRVEIHMIIGIYNPTHRLESWSDNVGQTDRNVLHLSPIITTISWDQWLILGGAKKVQGTSRVVSAHETLASFLRTKIGNIEHMKETGESIIV